MARYYRTACQLCELAQEVCVGKLVVVREGGYNPGYVLLCVYAVGAGGSIPVAEVREKTGRRRDSEMRCNLASSGSYKYRFQTRPDKNALWPGMLADRSIWRAYHKYKGSRF